MKTERRVHPNLDVYEKARSVLRENRLVFKHPFGVVIKQAFQKTSKASIVLSPAGLHSQAVTLGDNTHCC